MIAPAIIGFLSAIILNNFTAEMPIARADFLPNFGSGKISIAVEEINHLPLNAYKYFHQENCLPSSKDKIFVPRKNSGAEDISIVASSSLVMDKKSGEIIFGFNSEKKQPIASITKLMAALVFLDFNPDWNKIYQIKKEDLRLGGKSYIYEGDEIKIGDLFHLALVASDNTAVISLISSLGLKEEEFAAKMNEKAKNFGMSSTFFEDATGLSRKNISTAKEVFILADKSFKRKNIRETVLKKNYEFSTIAGRTVVFGSTNELLSVFPQNGINLVGGKTGYTNEAGYCLASEFSDNTGHEIVSVVLGAASEEARFSETKKIVDWVYRNFTWVAE